MQLHAHFYAIEILKYLYYIDISILEISEICQFKLFPLTLMNNSIAFETIFQHLFTCIIDSVL